MTLLADLRTALRKDLHDTDAGAYRWTDDDLNRAIARAVEEYSLAWPAETSLTFGATEDVRDYALTGDLAITRRLAVRRVEYPSGHYPPQYVPWELHNDTLTLLVDPPPQAGETIRVLAEQYHEVTVSSSTVPAHHDHVILTGAAAFALDEWATYAVNRINASTWTVRHFADRAKARLDDFRRQLAQLKQQRAQLAQSTTTITGYEV